MCSHIIYPYDIDISYISLKGGGLGKERRKRIKNRNRVLTYQGSYHDLSCNLLPELIALSDLTL